MSGYSSAYEPCTNVVVLVGGGANPMQGIVWQIAILYEKLPRGPELRLAN